MDLSTLAPSFLAGMAGLLAGGGLWKLLGFLFKQLAATSAEYRKNNSDLIDRLTKRIDALEAENLLCQQNTAKLSQHIGELEEKVRQLEEVASKPGF